MAFGNENTHILGTESMIRFAKASPKQRFLIATETGILHRLRKDVPGKTFEAVSEEAICKYMKMITLEKLRDQAALTSSRRCRRRFRRRGHASTDDRDRTASNLPGPMRLYPDCRRRRVATYCWNAACRALVASAPSSVHPQPA
jgi:hypothetical protein